MTKQEKIIENLKNSKEFQKNLNRVSFYREEDFIKDAQRYIKAIRENRVICSIPHVSNSGMSRDFKFLECSISKYGANWYNFHAFLLAMGQEKSRRSYDCFRVGGCGMDMIFHTNYTIIHRLGRFGFLNKKQVDDLAQNTPTVI